MANSYTSDDEQTYGHFVNVECDQHNRAGQTILATTPLPQSPYRPRLLFSLVFLLSPMFLLSTCAPQIAMVAIVIKQIEESYKEAEESKKAESDVPTVANPQRPVSLVSLDLCPSNGPHQANGSKIKDFH